MKKVATHARRILAALAVTVSVAVLGWAAPAFADGERSVSVWDDTYTGSYVVATLRWMNLSNGLYSIEVTGDVYDMEADGYAAIAQLTYWSGDTQGYQLPIVAKAPSNHTTGNIGDFTASNVKWLYIRSCLYKAATGPRHCSPWR